ncbi:MAG: hypothetical protein D6805_01810 [Planctomycetota bacterium]|nr:MAG: hypothetical protein D6805_01810 [Planctomycetota bacterium]
MPNNEVCSINTLIHSFLNPHILKRFRAAQQLIRQKESLPALLEALNSHQKDIVDFSTLTLIWAKDIGLLPLLVQRILSLCEKDALTHPLYKVLLGYGELSIPFILQQLHPHQECPQIFCVVEEILGSSRLPLPDKNLEIALEFEDFLKEIHCLMIIETPSLSFSHLQHLKKWWQKNLANLPKLTDMHFLDDLFSKPLNQLPKLKGSWNHWWKKNREKIERYIHETYLEAILENIASQTEEKKLNEEQEFPLHHWEEKKHSPTLHWNNFWKMYKLFRKKTQKSPLETLYQSLWYIKMDNFFTSLSLLNSLATTKILHPKPGRPTKKHRSILEEIFQEIQDFLLWRSGISSEDDTLAKLNLAVIFELLGHRQKAKKYLQEEVSLEGPADIWWFGAYYYQKQILGRLLFKSRQFKQSFFVIRQALETAFHIFLLKQSFLPDSLPHPLEVAAKNSNNATSLPLLGEEFPKLYYLQYKILTAWNTQSNP